MTIRPWFFTETWAIFNGTYANYWDDCHRPLQIIQTDKRSFFNRKPIIKIFSCICRALFKLAVYKSSFL